MPRRTCVFVADTEAPCSAQSLAIERGKFCTTKSDNFVGSGLCLAKSELYRSPRWCDQLYAKIVKTRMADIDSQSDSIATAVAIDDNTANKRRHLQCRDGPGLSWRKHLAGQ